VPSNMIYLQLSGACECLQELNNHLIKCAIPPHAVHCLAPVMLRRTNYTQYVIRVLLALSQPLTVAKSGGPAIIREEGMHMVILFSNTPQMPAVEAQGLPKPAMFFPWIFCCVAPPTCTAASTPQRCPAGSHTVAELPQAHSSGDKLPFPVRLAWAGPGRERQEGVRFSDHYSRSAGAMPEE